MTGVLAQFEHTILELSGLRLENITEDPGCKDYAGHYFQIGEYRIIFRKAKTTPKKNGLFVSLWKRNAEQRTEPFHTNDDIDFYIILTGQHGQSGFFIFPEKVLSSRHILSTPVKAGRRGFRVYPDWTQTGSRQAGKTRLWQGQHFINLKNEEQDLSEKLRQIFSK